MWHRGLEEERQHRQTSISEVHDNLCTTQASRSKVWPFMGKGGGLHCKALAFRVSTKHPGRSLIYTHNLIFPKSLFGQLKIMQALGG